ncbi:unnamed protein product, partial [Effrenium voratum]
MEDDDWEKEVEDIKNRVPLQRTVRERSSSRSVTPSGRKPEKEKTAPWSRMKRDERHAE